jgi:hypothetical protein
MPRPTAAELRRAATTLRGLAAPDRPVSVSSFAPFAVAQLLEAIGDALDDGAALPEPVSRRAVEIARHLVSYHVDGGPG